jgi:hypothetical protein
LLEPQREANLLPLSGQHVDASRTHDSRQQTSYEPGVPQLVAVLLRRHAAEKITADKLLGNRRPALREER